MAEQVAPFKYWAFLSYSHHDKRVAKRLVTELAAKVVPRLFRNRVAGRPARFAPVFRDERDVPVAPSLEPALIEALDSSARLIVICSPFAVASSYVAAEIRHFLARGRAADILCLVASGIPSSTDSGRPELECLPRPLREHTTPEGEIQPVPLSERPLAAALGEESKAEWAAAVEQLTSGLLGVSQTELRRLQQRVLLKRSAAAAAAALVVAAGGYFAWREFFAPHTAFYRDFERRYGVWHGIDPVSQETAQKLTRAYVFTTRGRRAYPERVRFVAHGAACAESGMRSILGNTLIQACSAAKACEARFGYTAGGDIHWEALYDQFGRELERLVYTSPSTGQFIDGDYGCKRTGTGIQYVGFERHTAGIFAGLEKRRQFRAGPASPRRNNSGVHGVALEYDPNAPTYGRISRVTYVDADGALELSNSGYAGRTSTFNARGQQIRKEFFGSNGAPIITNEGYAALTYAYDLDGNLTEERYFDTSGKPVLDKNGIAGRRWERDPRGLPIVIVHFDRDGNPSPNNDGIASMRHDYDERFLLRRILYFSADGQPAYDEIGAAGVAYERNAHDVMLSHTALDRDGMTPIFPATENTTHRIEYDAVGNSIRDRYFGPDGSPALNIKRGVAGYNSFFDSKGRNVKGEAIGLNGELVPTWVEGALGGEDQFGSSIGAAYYTSVFDDAGNETERRWFDARHAPTANNLGYAGYRFKYDERGRAIEMAYLDREGKIGRDRDGVSFVEYTHDDWDRTVEFRNLNAERKLHELPSGYAVLRRVYDERGNWTEATYFDSRGAPSAGDEGYFRTVRRLDAQGRKLGERAFSADGKPFEMPHGRHGIDYTLDERGRIIRADNIGIDGRPTLAPGDGDRSGFDFVHDAYGRVIEKRGRCFEKSPCASSVGIAIERTSYDRRGWPIVTRFFGEDGAPVADGDGVYGDRFEYNDFGKVTRRCTIGTDDKPAAVKGKSVACMEYRYNERNLPVETRYFDASGAPTRSGVPLSTGTDACAVERTRYDDWGRRTAWYCHAANGEPIVRQAGSYHSWSRTYDIWGNALDETYFDVKADRTVRFGGGRRISRHAAEYDIRNRVVRERYFDIEDKPVADDQGVHEIRRNYAGGEHSFETFDVDGNKIVPGDPTRYERSPFA
jgi:hypothetical protein